MTMIRVPYPELCSALVASMERLGLEGERGELCARLFAETTRDGVYTHGVDRLPRFAGMVRNGSVDVSAEAAPVASVGALERWDGRRGPGNLNAHAAMTRAIGLAREHGLGGVALANTNHWMRGGTYGWMAAEAGVFSLCWTNTLANLPAWGARTPTLGNNPLVIAIPRPEGRHVVLDMAMSQFSYGALAKYTARGEELPVPGGYDAAGELTRDAAAIEASQRALAIGYWKGSGLSLVLDMLAAMLSGGRSTHELPMDPMRESGVSQVFLAVDAERFAGREELDRIADGVLASLRSAEPVDAGKPVRYPGEETLRLRAQNLQMGVPVDAARWDWLRALDF